MSMRFLDNLNRATSVLRSRRVVNFQVENRAWLYRGPTTLENQFKYLDKLIKMETILEKVFL